MGTHSIYIWTLSFLVYLQLSDVSSQTTIRTTQFPQVRTSQGPTIFVNLHGVTPITFNDYLGAYLGYAWVGGTPAGQVDLNTCRSTCQARSNPQCLSFDYNTQYGECFLHLEGDVDSCKNDLRSVCSECLHYKKLSVYCGNIQTFFDEYARQQSYNGVQRPGDHTKEQCLVYCQREENCYMVDYNSGDKSCWWHSQCSESSTCIVTNSNPCSVAQYRKKTKCMATTPTTPVPTSTIATGTVSTTEDPQAGAIYDDIRASTSYSGGVKVGNFDQADYCKNECYKATSCQGVDYNTADNSCWTHTSSSVCGTERLSCTTCTHYKNKRALCYTPSGTQSTSTTQVPPGSTPTSIFSNFKPLENNRDINVDGAYKLSMNLEECLAKCNADSSCHAASYYSQQGQCFHYNVDQACGIRRTLSGWLLYGHIRQTCGQPIFNDFHAGQNNKKRPISSWRAQYTSLQSCLTACKGDPNCKGVNYQLVTNRCEHVLTLYQCRAVITAPNFAHYTIKTLNCNPGVSTTTTTTEAPVTIISQCWNRMTQRGQCTKPALTTANLALRIEEMENHCRTYNVYFECVVSKFKASECPTVSRTALENFVSTIADLRTKGTNFCRIFSQGLQTCLATNVVKNEINRCHNQVRPNNAQISGVTTLANCNKLRDYIECVGSVVEYRCREFSPEYNDKSTKYILLPIFSNCARSEPKIAGMNARFGPKTGQSLLAITGRDISQAGNSQIRFNATINACSGAVVTRNLTHFICKTRAGQVGQFYFVQLRYLSGAYSNVYFVTGNFTYTLDPVVTSLTPTTTVVGGGTLVTVVGTSLAYVVTPTFRVTQEGTNNVYESVCRVNEEDDEILDLKTLVCEVPPITVPGAVTVRSGQQVNNVVFMTGLLLDGVNRYLDLGLAGILEVYGPPDIDENTEKSFEFKTFWPVKQTKLEIPGENLDTAASARDYTVLIGPKPCTDLEITATMITCEPPAENPYTNDTQPPIIVKAPGPDGFQTGIQVGTLHYQDSIFDNSAGKYGLIGAGVGVVVLFIILIVICCCCCEGCACNNRNKGYDDSISERS